MVDFLYSNTTFTAVFSQQFISLALLSSISEVFPSLRLKKPEFQGHHTNQAYYKLRIMSPEYPKMIFPFDMAILNIKLKWKI